MFAENQKILKLEKLHRRVILLDTFPYRDFFVCDVTANMCQHSFVRRPFSKYKLWGVVELAWYTQPECQCTYAKDAGL